MEVIHDHLAQGPNVLACDGALATCLDNDIVPDAVVGDMDSVNGDVLERFVRLGGEVHERKEQDAHDLAKALVLAGEQGHSSCIVIGATGGDREHEWANLLVAQPRAWTSNALVRRTFTAFFFPEGPIL